MSNVCQPSAICLVVMHSDQSLLQKSVCDSSFYRTKEITHTTLVVKSLYMVKFFRLLERVNKGSG